MSSYPGARWWKFDFHTHTPASRDTAAWQRAADTPEEMTPEKWLLQFMAAEINCVAVTDHNSGEWIDRLKNAYQQMKAQADRGQAPAGFRELTLFPGVEVSVQGGIHVLAILEPTATKGDIDTLLGTVRYQGTKGDSDGVTGAGLQDVLDVLLQSSSPCVPIPAHADGPKGLLRCDPGTRRSVVDANTLKQALEPDGILAVECYNDSSHFPECVAALEKRFARVLGSDCHDFDGDRAPGSNFTWVKMAHPTLEGLRLALLDGNGVSIRRSDEGPFDPNRRPAHTIEAIEIENARYMGNGQAARVELSPFFTAIIGGRGTGKSTLVHGLRLAAGRSQELPIGSEPQRQFEAFRKVYKGRNGDGALRDNTTVHVDWRHEDRRYRLSWGAAGSTIEVQEEGNGRFTPSSSQAVTPERFPLRIFSQGQVAALAGEGRKNLLSIIDEAAGVETHKKALAEAQRTFFAQRARLRELEGRLAELPEVERRIEEADRKLAAMSQSDSATVRQSFARAGHQEREVEQLGTQLDRFTKRIAELRAELALDDWPPQHFTDADADLLAWRREVDQVLASVVSDLEGQERRIVGVRDQLSIDPRVQAWRARVQAAKDAHRALSDDLAAQGVDDPGAFERLTHERSELDSARKRLLKAREDRDAEAARIAEQILLLVQRREEVTRARRSFLGRALANNPHVQIEVVKYGSDPRSVERELRELIEVPDDRFADDILPSDEQGPARGLAGELANTGETEKHSKVEAVKRTLLEADSRLGGHFRNHLKKKHEKPEFTDRVMAWFPEDDLEIKYKREGRWTPVREASQGQRSAALLAFLLAFGEEPLVLDQPEDDLDNHLIYDLIVQQIRENKLRRQLIIVTHNPNVVVNGDAELVHVMEFRTGQCLVQVSGALQESNVRREVCRVMEGGHEAFERRWKRLGKEV